jgi:hypothetical protein
MSGLSQHVVHPILLSCPAVLAATPHIHTCHDWVGPVIISEFVSNPGPTGIPAPGSADSTDWIELYNNGTQPVDLEGWILSDNKDPAQGWTMPSRPLRPAEYLLVYVTGGGAAVGTSLFLYVPCRILHACRHCWLWMLSLLHGTGSCCTAGS